MKMMRIVYGYVAIEEIQKYASYTLACHFDGIFVVLLHACNWDMHQQFETMLQMVLHPRKCTRKLARSFWRSWRSRKCYWEVNPFCNQLLSVCMDCYFNQCAPSCMAFLLFFLLGSLPVLLAESGRNTICGGEDEEQGHHPTASSVIIPG